MRERKKTSRKKQETVTPSLSSTSSVEDNDACIKNVRDVVFSSMNDVELQKALDNFLKKNIKDKNLIVRDLSILRDIITEYLDAYILFGYNLEGERVIVQQFKTPKDRDAIMDFLKTIFLRQQHENFLDDEGYDD
jgi:predicted NodU family carbamoyl transferase